MNHQVNHKGSIIGTFKNLILKSEIITENILSVYIILMIII